MCTYDNIFDFENQDILDDSYVSAKTGNKKSQGWRDKKMKNELLALAYDVVNSDKASRLRACSTSLTFAEYADGEKKLIGMNSCRVRLCPLCTWRRSLKNYYNNKKICDYLEKNSSGAWLLLTLTVRNCKYIELSDEIDNLMRAWKLFTKNVAVKKVIRGYYRGLEVTHDSEEFITKDSFKRRCNYLKNLGLKVGDRNPTFDSYHPHFHALIYVDKSYFKSRKYLTRDDWVLAWQQALGVDYLPNVDVRRVKDTGNGIIGSIAEISKYACKDTDYIIPDDWDLTVDVVRTLDSALANRRLIAYGGEVRAAFKALKLEDADNGNLIDVGEEQLKTTDDFKEVTYFWHTGYRQYFKGSENNGNIKN